MGREASVTLADDSRNFAKLQVAVGLVCIAVLVLEYAGQLGLRPTAQPFGQLGEATSYHSLRYDLVGFWLPGGLLVVFGVGLRRVLGASWLSAGALVVLTVLGMCTFLLGLLPYSPDSLQTQLVRQAARALYLWSPSCAAFLAGGALLTQRRRGQAAFSVGCGVLMAVLAFWLTAFSATSVDAAPVEIATPWYVGTAAWLLQRSAVVGKQRWSRLVETPLIVIRLLAAVGIAALAAYVTDIGVPLLPLAIAQMDGTTQVATLDGGGLQRHFRVYRPNRISPSPGLVIVLHGAQGTGLQAEIWTGLDAQAHRLGWIAVYPDGYRDGWDAYGCCHHAGVDDVAFIVALIDRLEATDRVDPNRIYVTGMSRGGMMSYRLGCELSSRIVAIAPVAGNMATRDGSAQEVGCRPARPVSVLAIHGTLDPNAPYAGGYSSVGQGTYASFNDVIGVWREIDGCAASSSMSVSGRTTTTIWPCRAGSTIETKVISGGQHYWPGAPVGAPRLPWATDTRDVFDASTVIANFFVAHRRTGGTAVSR